MTKLKTEILKLNVEVRHMRRCVVEVADHNEILLIAWDIKSEASQE